MYENDPDRLNRPRVGDPPRNPLEDNNAGTGVMAFALAAAAIIALGLMFWPGERAPTVTENAPRVERPAPTPTTPPANKPVTPTTPAPNAPK